MEAKTLRFIWHLIFNFGIIELFSIFFIAINVFTFLLYVIDKRRAIKGKWRISENMLIFFTVSFGGLGALLGMYTARHKTKKRKFKIAAVIGLIAVTIPVIHIIHALTLDRIIVYREIQFHSENWPVELNGYRIAFMTDMHVIPDEDMRAVASELNERNLDLLILGGDFSMNNSHYVGTLREISAINTTDGIFGVEGNHDDYIRLFAAKKLHGITPLDNNGIHIQDGFYLAGVRDMWNRDPNINEAISDAYENDFILLISHNPDVSMIQDTNEVDLILSGHTHRGQITFFGFPMYLLLDHITSYRTRFGYEFAYSRDETPVFTSSGVGVYYNVPRIFARPEVVIFTMYSYPCNTMYNTVLSWKFLFLPLSRALALHW